MISNRPEVLVRWEQRAQFHQEQLELQLQLERDGQRVCLCEDPAKQASF